MKKDIVDFTGKTVLIINGGSGVGRAATMAYAHKGAACLATFQAQDINEHPILNPDEKEYPVKPVFIKAEVTSDNDAQSLMEQVKQRVDKIDIFVYCLPVTALVSSFPDSALTDLKQAISDTTWPFIRYVQAVHHAFQQYPKHIINLSVSSLDDYCNHCDFANAAKSITDVMLKYLAYRLRAFDVCVNSVLTYALKPRQSDLMERGEIFSYLEQQVPENYWTTFEEVIDTLLALSSGNCDSISGQIILIDKGAGFFDNLTAWYSKIPDGEGF